MIVMSVGSRHQDIINSIPFLLSHLSHAHTHAFTGRRVRSLVDGGEQKCRRDHAIGHTNHHTDAHVGSEREICIE